MKASEIRYLSEYTHLTLDDPLESYPTLSDLPVPNDEQLNPNELLAYKREVLSQIQRAHEIRTTIESYSK